MMNGPDSQCICGKTRSQGTGVDPQSSGEPYHGSIAGGDLHRFHPTAHTPSADSMFAALGMTESTEEWSARIRKQV